MESTFQELAEKCTNRGLRDVFEVIYDRQKGRSTADAAKPISHSPDDLRFIRALMYDEVKAGMARDGVPFLSLDECRRDVRHQFARQVVRMTRDGFFNPTSGAGMPYDPGMANTAFVPVSMAPEEATAYYSSGGIPRVIIDKKSRGVLLTGYSFAGGGWSEDEVKQLHEHAQLKGFDRSMADGLRDSLVYGGAAAYPHFKKDTPLSTGQSVKELLDAGILEKDCIDHFVTVDRWNTVLVPNWDVTAEDYIYPRAYYVPIGGVKVATERSAIIRPNMLPFWGAIRQIGWGVSDFEGFIRSLLGYEIMVMQLPILFQQMSLLFQALPLDGPLIQNGPEAVEEIMKKNEEKLREASSINPKAIGMAGELKTIERHYEALDSLFMIARQDVAAKSEIPESVIFHTQSTGFSDNDDDILLKQSEAITRIQVAVTPSFKPMVRMLAISCFGPTPEVLAKLHTLGLKLDVPIVQTPSQKAESGGKFADVVQKLVTATLPLDCAIDVALEFFEDVEIPKSVLDRIKQVPDELDEGYTPLQAIEAVLEKTRQLAGQTAGPAVKRLEFVAEGVRELAGGNGHSLERLQSAGEQARALVPGWTADQALDVADRLDAIADRIGAMKPEIHLTMPEVKVEIHNDQTPTVTTFSPIGRKADGTLDLSNVKVTKVPIGKEAN